MGRWIALKCRPDLQIIIIKKNRRAKTLSRLAELLEKEATLEKEREEYLEAENLGMAKSREKQLYKVRDLIEIETLEEKVPLKSQLDVYKAFITKWDLEKKFEEFYNAKLAKEDKDE